jgi:hypothetical protein
MIPLQLESLNSLARKIESGAREYVNLHAELIRQGYTEKDVNYTYSDTSGISLIGFFHMEMDKEEFLHRIRDIQTAMDYPEFKVHDAEHVKHLIADTYHNGIEISFWLGENPKCKWVKTGKTEIREKMKVICE